MHQSEAMTRSIREAVASDYDAVVELALRAWASVFPSVNDVLGPDLAALLHGQDWREHQAREVREVLASRSTQVWVAEADAHLVGFAGARIVDPQRLIGEIAIVAVDPGAQHQGIGTDLTARWPVAAGTGHASCVHQHRR